MDRNKRAGAWVIAGAIVASIAALFFSDGWSGDVSFWTRFMEVLYIPTFPCDFEPGSTWCRAYYPVMEFRFGIPTKYAVLACIAVATWGVLLVRGVASFPSRISK